ncbi:MAG: deoxyribose-phosphate aldolase [Actinobacteria bacterium]|nr:deoxyribose-phosphate aldolase [Actinomycetota bacterium]
MDVSLLSHTSLASCIDQTFLKPTSGFEAAEKWVTDNVNHDFATLCVSPCFAPLAYAACAGNPSRVCSVVGFPNGSTSSATKCFEAIQLIKNGCSELDIVMNIGAFLEGDEAYVAKETIDIITCVHASAQEEIIFKVILETAYLSENQICSASDLLSQTGVHFIKTSTGFAPRGASVNDIRLIASSIAGDCGIKASGGIRTLSDAIEMLAAGATRIGTSAGDRILAEFDVLMSDH